MRRTWRYSRWQPAAAPTKTKDRPGRRHRPAAAAAANAAASTVPVPSHETAAATPMPPPGGATPGKAAHHTVATVNGKPIPEEKVYALYRMNRSTLAQRGRTLTDNDERC